MQSAFPFTLLNKPRQNPKRQKTWDKKGEENNFENIFRQRRPPKDGVNSD
jgi:hypothetical protein